jgi:hypothetical protein
MYTRAIRRQGPALDLARSRGPLNLAPLWALKFRCDAMHSPLNIQRQKKGE